ncbi:hypothetical protein PR202_ga04416 [Eleusine coracana subsp. coracana]|uniref:Myb-like domain-containing protein n=1 Tax=Eleusine coracana subsp. coracana TaxID=191504 RepID=A0AAV5BQW0_ELECO|nr:hypothetical protein PR202_ga04416 [Eleusine coracana subsp. coracana]
MNGDVRIEDINLTNDVPLDVTPLAPKKRSRTGNYSTAEDEALVLAWENVSIDPIIGTDQDRSTYWDRIAEHYNRNVKSTSKHTTKSLQQRWCTIQESCNRWTGCIESIEAHQPSSTMIQDQVSFIHWFSLHEKCSLFHF